MTRARTIAIAAIAVALLVGAGVIGVRVLRAPDPAYLPQMVRVDEVAGKTLWVQKREVTLADWSRCHNEGACTLALAPPAFATEEADWPATGLSYLDVSEYLDWINARARHPLRLPTMAEWRVLAAPVLPEEPDPIFTDPDLSWASTYLTENLVDRRLRPSQSWTRTEEGVWDLDGNVWEWTRDCYLSKEEGGDDANACPAFFVGGEHEAVIPYLVRDPARGGCAVGAPPPHLGMRLVSDEAVPTP